MHFERGEARGGCWQIYNLPKSGLLLSISITKRSGRAILNMMWLDIFLDINIFLIFSKKNYRVSRKRQWFCLKKKCFRNFKIFFNKSLVCTKKLWGSKKPKNSVFKKVALFKSSIQFVLLKDNNNSNLILKL